MTAENRWLFDVADILQVHIVCTKCKAAFSVPPHKVQRIPPQCVNCGEQFYGGGSKEQEALDQLKDALNSMRLVGASNFKVRLEFDAPTTHTSNLSRL